MPHSRRPCSGDRPKPILTFAGRFPPDKGMLPALLDPGLFRGVSRREPGVRCPRPARPRPPFGWRQPPPLPKPPTPRAAWRAVGRRGPRARKCARFGSRDLRPIGPGPGSLGEGANNVTGPILIVILSNPSQGPRKILCSRVESCHANCLQGHRTTGHQTSKRRRRLREGPVPCRPKTLLLCSSEGASGALRPLLAAFAVLCAWRLRLLTADFSPAGFSLPRTSRDSLSVGSPDFEGFHPVKVRI